MSSTTPKTALIMAGGTGGHIFPGLAVAEELRARGWRVHWLGAPNSMEARIVPAQGFALETIDFSGVRGKGLATLLGAPLRILRAVRDAARVLRNRRPAAVISFGGYAAGPGGIAARIAWTGRHDACPGGSGGERVAPWMAACRQHRTARNNHHSITTAVPDADTISIAPPSWTCTVS